MALKDVSYNLQTVIVNFLNERVNEKKITKIYTILKSKK